jgi:hypothetical protein
MARSSVIGAAKSERLGVIGLGALVIVSVAAYLALKSSVLQSTGPNRLLPYQTLSRTLVSSEQETFADLQKQVIDLERVRAATGRWPGAETLDAASPYVWSHAREGFYVNYLARPSGDESAAAWLIVIQEPDPQAPPDTAPNDETHHRLPDGTVLHVTIWSHRFGSQVGHAFVRQPETTGWTQILTAPVATVSPMGNRS